MMGRDMAACDQVNYRSECVNAYSLKGIWSHGGGRKHKVNELSFN